MFNKPQIKPMGGSLANVYATRKTNTQANTSLGFYDWLSILSKPKYLTPFSKTYNSYGHVCSSSFFTDECIHSDWSLSSCSSSSVSSSHPWRDRNPRYASMQLYAERTAKIGPNNGSSGLSTLDPVYSNMHSWEIVHQKIVEWIALRGHRALLLFWSLTW